MKGWKHIAGGLLMGCSALTAVTAAHADQLDNIEKSGTLKVAVPQDFPPFGSVGTDLQPHGYDIDMAQYLADKMHVKLQLVPVSSANRIPYLQTGKADLVISSLGKNPEREKVIDFSQAYAPFFLGIFGTQAISVSKPADLAGKTIGVTRGAVEDLELSKIVPSSTTVQRFEDNNTTLSAYRSGQVDLIATGNVVISDIAGKMADRKPVTKFMLKNSPCYIGLNKGEDRLKAKVNSLITEAHQDGTLNKFSETWLKAPLPADL